MNTILQKRIEEAAQRYASCLIGEDQNQQPLIDAFIQIATFALQNQWISVDEALPTEKVIIAKLSNDFCGKDGCYEILYRIAKEHIDLRHPDGYYDSCGENVPTSAITNWMSTPLYPKAMK